jgi:hypothetical protein
MNENGVNDEKNESSKIENFHIFKNEDYTQDGFDHELSQFGMACLWLAIAVEADEGNNSFLRKEAFKIADSIGYRGESWAYNTLRNSAMVDIAHSWHLEHNEARYYGLFEKYVKDLLGKNASIAEGKNSAKSRPDKWVEMYGAEIPVEMKNGDFDAKALKQLQRYMKEFNSKVGIAVGKSITVDCPSNVVFVKTELMDYLESAESKKITLEDILSR